jgi:hypothetical protein
MSMDSFVVLFTAAGLLSAVWATTTSLPAAYPTANIARIDKPWERPFLNLLLGV